MKDRLTTWQHFWDSTFGRVLLLVAIYAAGLVVGSITAHLLR